MSMPLRYSWGLGAKCRRILVGSTVRHDWFAFIVAVDYTVKGLKHDSLRVDTILLFEWTFNQPFRQIRCLSSAIPP